ncbi:MAG: M23 family metallopeptidase [Corynebacteriales bacterium]|nr:M23 family metallopeptidase [Mycobacteriales bacterium]
MALLCGGLLPALFFDSSSPLEDEQLQAASCNFNNPGGGAELGSVGNLSKEQMGHARTIVDVGWEMKVPSRGWIVAIATAMQESNLRNLAHLGARNDHDSIGLFQQRPSQGWGSELQLMDPRYTSRKFYEKLLTVPNWQQLEVTVAAQRVQRSAFPDAYAKWESLAIQVVDELTRGGTYGRVSYGANPMCADPGVVSASGWVVPTTGPVGSGFRTRERPQHNGVDVIVPRYTSIRAASAGTVVTVLCNASTNNCDVDGSPQVKGCGWYVEVSHGNGFMTRYCHMVKQPSVKVGDRVTAGQLLGEVGSSGNSSGPHLHYEVHFQGDPINPEEFMSAQGAPMRA